MVRSQYAHQSSYAKKRKHSNLQGGASTTALPVRSMRHRTEGAVARKTGLTGLGEPRVRRTGERRQVAKQLEGFSSRTTSAASHGLISTTTRAKPATKASPKYSCDEKGYLNFSKGLVL